MQYVTNSKLEGDSVLQGWQCQR